MLKDNIKPTAITYKGYDYQTLFGVSILADWLNFPDKYQKVFEIFIGKDFGDFKPSFEQIDLLRLGDKIEIYFDVDQKETDGRLNRLIQYIDKDSTPYYIRGNKDKIFGIGFVSFGLISILTLLILKQKDKIE